MFKNIVKLSLLVLISASFSAKTKAASIVDDVQRFFTNVTHDAKYNHFLTIGSAICSYHLLENAINHNTKSFHDWFVKGIAVLGAMAVSKVVHEYPDQATLLCLGALCFHLLKKHSFL